VGVEGGVVVRSRSPRASAGAFCEEVCDVLGVTLAVKLHFEAGAGQTGGGADFLIRPNSPDSVL
jgi:hypothetical protein